MRALIAWTIIVLTLLSLWWTTVKARRILGQALGRNPFPIIVPCHRVLAAGGKSGGFSAPGGVETKRRMLEIEGAKDLHPTLPF